MTENITSELKVVIINDMLWGGGRERRIVQLITGLNRLGVNRITLILLDDRIDYPEIFNLNVNVIKIARKSRRDFSVFVKLYRVLSEIKPKIVNPWSFMSVFYAAPICWLLGLPCVGSFVVDAKAPKRFSVNWIGMWVGFLLCRKIIANSLAGHKAYQTPERKQIVIYNGFNDARLKSIPSKSSNSNGIIRIAMIGRLDQQKDYRTYIDALDILINKGVNFQAYIAGQGEDFDSLKAYADERCKCEIVFTGFMHDIDQFISKIDIGVLCTNPIYHAEGISNAILELMAQGKPVIATNGGGTPELITDGVDGFLIPPHDSLVLANRMEMLCKDNSLRRKLGKNAEKKVSTKFSLGQMSTEFLRAYHECI